MTAPDTDTSSKVTDSSVIVNPSDTCPLYGCSLPIFNMTWFDPETLSSGGWLLTLPIMLRMSPVGPEQYASVKTISSVSPSSVTVTVFGAESASSDGSCAVLCDESSAV